jgi:hypothetical protein
MTANSIALADSPKTYGGLPRRRLIGDLPYKAKAVYLCAAAAERYRSTLLLSTKVVPVSINTG